jgi:hypothetical protein
LRKKPFKLLGMIALSTLKILLAGTMLAIVKAAVINGESDVPIGTPIDT